MKYFNGLNKIKTLSIIRSALVEDIGKGDITTKTLFPKQISVRGKIIAKEDGVICGLPVAEQVFKILDEKIRLTKRVREGSSFKKGQTICLIRGDARKILTGERTVLNFLGRLSGIATLTRKYVERVRPYKVKIMDTRKTTPGLRALEKYAVKCGGGYNHRMGLWDQVLVKDNHIAVISHQSSVIRKKKTLGNIIKEIRRKVKKGIKIEIEVQNLKGFREALRSKPDIIMLDNMRLSDIKKGVEIRNKLPITNSQLPITRLEVSGGVSLANVRAIAKTGVDMISIGSLTHSAPSLDFSLEIV